MRLERVLARQKIALIKSKKRPGRTQPLPGKRKEHESTNKRERSVQPCAFIIAYETAFVKGGDRMFYCYQTLLLIAFLT